MYNVTALLVPRVNITVYLCGIGELPLPPILVSVLVGFLLSHISKVIFNSLCPSTYQCGKSESECEYKGVDVEVR